MGETWLLAALWLGLALVATLLSIWFRMSTALTEIVVGTVAQLIIGAAVGSEALGVKAPWIGFLAGTGAIVLTFLAGAELDPSIFRTKWKESFAVGLVGFFGPFLGAAAVARFLLGWSYPASWLAGIALSTTSVAVVYAVMLELGFNRTSFGKGILAACFINDLGTVIALGLIFAPFTTRTLVFVGLSLFVFLLLPFVTPWFFERFGGRVSELEAKYILFLVFGMGGLAAWAGSEAVLPAYIIGMVLAGSVGKDHILIRRLRTLTFGLLTPFYFIRAGSLVSVSALVATPLVFVALFFAKMAAKLIGLVPTVRFFNYLGHEGLYYSLMMSTGLTFGTISALFGLNHGIISQSQYSHLVATVIGSAVIPTAIANAYFMPKHLLPDQAAVAGGSMSAVNMLSRGPAKKVTMYVNEDTRHHVGSLYEAILTFLMHKRVAGATASRAMAGFGTHHMMHTTKIEVLTEHLPIRIEFIETAEKVDELLPTLYDMLTDGLIEVQDTQVVKIAAKERKSEPRRPHQEIRGKAKLLRIYLGEADKWHGEPLYDAIVKRLRMMDISGATVHRGILGYGAKGHTHKQSFLHLSRDLPLMVAVIDSEEKIQEATTVVEQMVEDALIVVSEVDIVRLVRSNPLEEVADAKLPAS